MSELFNTERAGNRTHLIYLANYFQTTRLRKSSLKDNSFFVTLTLVAPGSPSALALPRKRRSPALPAQTSQPHTIL